MVTERREAMLELEKEVHTNTMEIREIHDLLMGPKPGRNNGINGALKTTVARLDTALEWAQSIWNVKRKDECFGLDECKKLSKRMDDFEKGDTDVRVAKVNLTGVYVLGILQFLGLLLVALIARA